MATKFECDRCGTQTTDRTEIGVVKIPRLSHYKYESYEDDAITKELCFNCGKQLHEFLAKLPVVVRS